MNEVWISVLAPGDLGQLARDSFPIEAETFLRALVSTPELIVAQLVGMSTDTWTKAQGELVAALSDAPDDRTREAVKKRIPAMAPARFRGERRSTDTCESRQIIGHDFDAVVAESFDDAVRVVRERLPDRFLVIHTTAKERNPDGSWRVRAFEILDRPATPDEWERRVKGHMRSIGADDNALDVARLLFLPLRTAGYQHAVFEGPRTRLDDLVAVAAAATPTNASASPPRATLAETPARRRDAAAALLGASWPKTGRHLAQLALAGALRRDGWAKVDAVGFLSTVCRLAGDEDRPKREATVEHTWSTTANVTGWRELEKHVDTAVVGAARGLVDRDGDAKRELAALTAAPTHATPLVKAAGPSNARRFQLVTAADLAAPLPPVTYVLRHFGIAPGRPSLLAGYGGIGKTFIVQALGLHIAAGLGSCWGLPVASGGVAHFDYEMTLPASQRRYQRLAHALSLDLSSCDLVLSSMPGIYMSDGDAFDAFVEACTGKVLAIVDNLAAATATALGSENDKGMRTYLDTLTRASDVTGCCFIVLVHEKKPSQNDSGGAQQLQRVRGSSAITDASGSVLSVSAAEGDGIVTISHTKTSLRKKGDELTLAIEDVGAAMGDDDPPGLLVRRLLERPVDGRADLVQSRILQLLERGPQPNKRAIETALRLKNGDASVHVDTLVVQRKVAKLPGRGFCVDTAAARLERIRAAVATRSYGTVPQIANAAHVDADVVQDAISTGHIARDGDGIFMPVAR